jgi:hypothetical protein
MVDEADIKDGEEQTPNWVKPTIYQPRSGTVSPGFSVGASIDVFNPAKWQLKVMEGDKQLYFVEERAGQYFDHYIKNDVIKPGSKFVVHVHYFAFPAWSQWASVNLVMADAKPIITEPVEGANTGPRPRVAGRGIPGATIKLYQANSGTVLFGTAVVDANGNWQTTPVVDFFEGPFQLVVNQTISNTEYWSDNVWITVYALSVSPPMIAIPDNGEIVKTDKPMVRGRGFPGAVVKLYQAYVGDTVFGTVDVPPSGVWSITPTVAFPKGQFSLTANQSTENGTSDWALVVTFIVDV